VWDNLGLLLSDKLYFYYNGHGDVTALINSGSGAIEATYYYDAFGNILEQTGTANNSITYAGYQYDKETGLYYLNARMYDPTTGRFLQEDTYRGSINDPLSLNLYTYCSNNPITYSDPTGHVALRELVGENGQVSWDNESKTAKIIYNGVSKDYKVKDGKAYVTYKDGYEKEIGKMINGRIDVSESYFNSTFIDKSEKPKQSYIFHSGDENDTIINDGVKFRTEELQQKYGNENVHDISFTGYSSTDNKNYFNNKWRDMGYDENGNPINIGEVAIIAHSPNGQQLTTRVWQQRLDSWGPSSIAETDIYYLENKNMDKLTIYACNAGRLDTDRNLATMIMKRVSGIKQVVSWKGYVTPTKEYSVSSPDVVERTLDRLNPFLDISYYKLNFTSENNDIVVRNEDNEIIKIY
jgi:RHS repeat-associated protein